MFTTGESRDYSFSLNLKITVTVIEGSYNSFQAVDVSLSLLFLNILFSS
jgi:hypothetical protein